MSARQEFAAGAFARFLHRMGAAVAADAPVNSLSIPAAGLGPRPFSGGAMSAPHVQVVPRPVRCSDPESFPDDMERYLEVLALTQTGPCAVELTLTPESTRALRARLRDGRKAAELRRRTRGFLADTKARLDRTERDMRQHTAFWIVALVVTFYWSLVS